MEAHLQAARARWQTAAPETTLQRGGAGCARCRQLQCCAVVPDRWTVLMKYTVMSEKIGSLAPERGTRPANGSRVGPPRRNSSPSSEHGALGRGSQALSAGSRLRSKAIILATNNEEQATDVTYRNLPEHAILLSTTSSRVLTEFRRPPLLNRRGEKR